MNKDDYFAKTVELLEKFNMGELTYEEYEQALSSLENEQEITEEKSEKLTDFERLIESSKSLEQATKDSITSLFPGTTKRKDRLQEIDSLTDSFKHMLEKNGFDVDQTEEKQDSISLPKVRDSIHSITSRIDTEKVGEVASKIGQAGLNFISSIPSKAKETHEFVKSVLPESIPTTSNECKNGNHKLYYLMSEIPSYNFKSERFRKMASNSCICRCLECGKEVSIFSNQINGNLISDREDLRSEKRFQEARKHYLRLKALGYTIEDIQTSIIDELNIDDEIILKL